MSTYKCKKHKTCRETNETNHSNITTYHNFDKVSLGSSMFLQTFSSPCA